MKKHAKHLLKSDNYFWIGTIFGWLVSFLVIIYQNSTEYLAQTTEPVTLGTLFFINIIAIFVVIWDTIIIFNSRRAISKAKGIEQGHMIVGALLIIGLVMFVLRPIITTVFSITI